MQLIIFGAPGVGKGTQAKILASKLNIAHISTGDILREAIKNETELGLKAKSIVESGGLVPDEIVAGMLKDVLVQDKCKYGFILDGFPRTVNQAKILDNIFKELGLSSILLVKLEAEDSIMISRITNRMVCNVCGNIAIRSEITNDFICPNCKSTNSYITRKDDTVEVVTKRLNVYHEQTSPVLEYYSGKVNIISVDGTKAINEITEDILEKLKN
ncbi:MAG: adenylate kinase [Melioribacteraceae bacterium]|jgi:adenylate kinase|nr:adenylate kinase [Melioribacteraceae bacterium]